MLNEKGGATLSSPTDLPGAGLRVKGAITGEGDFLLTGAFEGSIEVSGTVVIGPRSRADADIVARSVVVEGTVRGTLRATDQVAIRKTGIVIGRVTASRLSLEDGAALQGDVRIGTVVLSASREMTKGRE